MKHCFVGAQPIKTCDTVTLTHFVIYAFNIENIKLFYACIQWCINTSINEYDNSCDNNASL